jgi:hypothetical protein
LTFSSKPSIVAAIMVLARIAPALIVLGFSVAACKKTEPTEAQPAKAETPPAPPEDPDDEAPTREILERAYLADCSYSHETSVDDPSTEGGTKKGDECVVREFEQNCAPDRFGCWDKAETCKNACAKPCSDCQTKCASSCNDCKATCKGKPNADACMKGCASSRADCRNGCIQSLAECRSKSCEKMEIDCMTAGETQVKKECGEACDGYRACIEASFGGDGDEASCKKKFPKLSEKCREWCVPSD